jgi:hypothetical protein
MSQDGLEMPDMVAAPQIPLSSRHRIEADGVHVFYREAGPADAPVILLLHGFSTSSFQYRELLADFISEDFSYLRQITECTADLVRSTPRCGKSLSRPNGDKSQPDDTCDTAEAARAINGRESANCPLSCCGIGHFEAVLKA